MLILVDVGNTNILFGIVENNEITNTYRLITDLHGTKEYYREKINNYLVPSQLQKLHFSKNFLRNSCLMHTTLQQFPIA